MNTLKHLFALAALALLSACATAPTGQQVQTTESVEQTQGASVDTAQPAQEGATTSGLQSDSSVTMSALSDPDSPLAKRVIYFDFDSTTIAPEFRDLITAHAKFAAANPEVNLVLEGHADERGSREYNIGLGERRARAVQQVFNLMGTGNGQLSTVSYGEERPVVMGHDESSWRLNRRVEIVYQGQ